MGVVCMQHISHEDENHCQSAHAARRRPPPSCTAVELTSRSRAPLYAPAVADSIKDPCAGLGKGHAGHERQWARLICTAVACAMTAVLVVGGDTAAFAHDALAESNP